RRSLLVLHAVRPGIASPRRRGLLAGAVPPATRSRSGGDSPFQVLRADARLRAGREDAPLFHRARGSGGPGNIPVRRLRVARSGGRAATSGSFVELPLR